MKAIDPAEIAARMTPAQRRALLAFDGGVEPVDTPNGVAKSAWRRDMFRLRDAGILLAASRGARHRLAPLGMEVRAIIAQQEAGDGR